MNSWLDAVKSYFEIRNRTWINLDITEYLGRLCKSPDSKWYKNVRRITLQKHRALQLQGKRLLRVHTMSRIRDGGEVSKHNVQVQVEETIYWVYQDGTKFAVESRVFTHCQDWAFQKGSWYLVADRESSERDKYSFGAIHAVKADISQLDKAANAPRMQNENSAYERVKAIRYAELWWNDFNPTFANLHDDCTNFISQCLFAGRLPMASAASRASGWWYQIGRANENEPWSYSWAISQLLYHYLTHQIGAKRVASAKELKMGDLIFYDWDGSGRFHHTAIVTDFDEYGDPVVNAHSDASYHRPYTYFDSRAWTERTRYGFLHIPDRLNG